MDNIYSVRIINAFGITGEEYHTNINLRIDLPEHVQTICNMFISSDSELKELSDKFDPLDESGSVVIEFVITTELSDFLIYVILNGILNKYHERIIEYDEVELLWVVIRESIAKLVYVTLEYKKDFLEIYLNKPTNKINVLSEPILVEWFINSIRYSEKLSTFNYLYWVIYQSDIKLESSILVGPDYYHQDSTTGPTKAYVNNRQYFCLFLWDKCIDLCRRLRDPLYYQSIDLRKQILSILKTPSLSKNRKKKKGRVDRCLLM